MAADDLKLGQKVPNVAEATAVGLPTTKIKRDSEEFKKLVKNTNPDIVFKNEEGTGADRMMTERLSVAVNRLAELVRQEWPALRLRITEAWDEDLEHTQNSTHYEARAVDVTTSDIDGTKLGRLGRLAVNAGFGWVFFENIKHVHASVVK